MSKVSFIVTGEPQGKGRPRFRGKWAYTPPKTREYERRIKEAYKAASGGFSFGSEPIFIQVYAFLKIPKSASKKKKAAMMSGDILATKKPDFDNILKIIADALNKLAYNDDKQIVGCALWKEYAIDPKIVVTLVDRGETK